MSTITLVGTAAESSWHRRCLLPGSGLLAPRSDDEHLAFLLVATWSLRTGRRLRLAPHDQLTESELLEFWSDPEYDRPRVVSVHGRPGRRLTGAPGGAADDVTVGTAAADREGGRS